MRAVTFSKHLAMSCVAMLTVVLAFRAFLYSRLYIAPGEPYGISDLIEFGLGIQLLAMLALAGASAIWLAVRGPRSNRFTALWVGLTVVCIAVSVGPLHTVVARWASS